MCIANEPVSVSDFEVSKVSTHRHCRGSTTMTKEKKVITHPLSIKLAVINLYFHPPAQVRRVMLAIMLSTTTCNRRLVNEANKTLDPFSPLPHLSQQLFFFTSIQCHSTFVLCFRSTCREFKLLEEKERQLSAPPRSGSENGKQVT